MRAAGRTRRISLRRSALLELAHAGIGASSPGDTSGELGGFARKRLQLVIPGSAIRRPRATHRAQTHRSDTHDPLHGATSASSCGRRCEAPSAHSACACIRSQPAPPNAKVRVRKAHGILLGDPHTGSAIEEQAPAELASLAVSPSQGVPVPLSLDEPRSRPPPKRDTPCTTYHCE